MFLFICLKTAIWQNFSVLPLEPVGSLKSTDSLSILGIASWKKEVMVLSLNPVTGLIAAVNKLNISSLVLGIYTIQKWKEGEPLGALFYHEVLL